MATMTMDGVLPRSAALRPGIAPRRAAGARVGAHGAFAASIARETRQAHRSTGVHLTVRGRRVAFAVAVLAAGAAAFLVMTFLRPVAVSALTVQAAGGHAQLGAAAGSAAMHSVVVHPGDTLWSIARRELPDVDPVDAVGRIRAVNALAPTDALVAGSVITLPAV